MRSAAIYLALAAVLCTEACGLFRKSKPAPAPPATPTPAVILFPRIAPSVVSEDGVFPPGNAELTALQATRKEVTMQALKEGYTLYTGVCTGCHQAKSIYERKTDTWPSILTAMAKEANITEQQKNAIYEYVLSIKATQPE